MPPINDNFANATVLDPTEATTTSIDDDNTGATSDGAFDPLVNYAYGIHTVWYKIDPVAYDRSLDISTDDPTSGTPILDTVIGVFTGTVLSSLVEIVIDDDGGIGYYSLLSNVIIPASETCYIEVTGYSDTEEGAFSLTWSLNIPGVGDLVRQNFGDANPTYNLTHDVTTTAGDDYWIWISKPTSSSDLTDFDIKVSPIPPINDNITDATTARFNTGESSIYRLNEETNWATAETSEPNHGGSPASYSVWYKFFPRQGVDYDFWIEESPSGTDPAQIYKISVYDYSSTIGGLGASLGEASGLASTNPTVTAQSGPYGLVIAVDSPTQASGQFFALRAVLSQPPTPPANDSYLNPTVVSSVASGSFSGTTVGATIQPPYEGTSRGGTVWYEYTPALTGDTTLTWTTTYSITVRIFLSVGGVPGSQVATASGTSGTIGTGLTPGTTYLISVDTYDDQQQSFTVNTAEIATPPGNNAYSTPTDITGSGAFSSDLGGASQETGEPTEGPGSNPIRSVWYKITPPHDCIVTFAWTVQNGDQIDLWTGTALENLAIVPGYGSAGNYRLRLRKDEEYWVRHWNSRTVAAGTPRTITPTWNYEMDTPYVDAVTHSWTNSGGILAIEPFLNTGGKAAEQNVWVSMDVKLTGGKVLGRFNYDGYIGLIRFKDTSGSYTNMLNGRIGGDINGNFWLSFLNGDITYDGAPAPTTEDNSGWVRLEFQSYINNVGFTSGLTNFWVDGVYKGYVVGLQGSIKTIEIGPYTWPVTVGSPFPAGPDPWTLQIKNIRITDSRYDGPAGVPGANIMEFDSLRTPTRTNYTSYGHPTLFDADDGASINDITAYMQPNPDGARDWETIRLTSTGGSFNYPIRDAANFTHGYWMRFAAFPTNNANSWVVTSRMWLYDGNQSPYSFGHTGTGFGMAQLEVRADGRVWLYPYSIYGSRTVDNSYDLGKIKLNEWYYIEVEVDKRVGWDTICRVAINGIQCSESYSSRLLRDKGDAVMASLRYKDKSTGYVNVNIGMCTGDLRPFAPSSGAAGYNGNASIYFGSPSITRVSPFPLGPLASFALDAGASDGTHNIPDLTGLDFYDVGDQRWYGGTEENMNTDMSIGGTPPSGWGGSWLDAPQSAGRAADSSGPPGHTGEDAAVLFPTVGLFEDTGKTLFGPIGYDEVAGDSLGWNSDGAVPDSHTGGDPLDDGTNVQSIFAWVRYTGTGSATITMPEVHSGGWIGPFPGQYYANSPTYTLSDNNWHYIWLGTLPFYNVLPSSGRQGGILHYNVPNGAINVKQVRVFTNARSFPRFLRTSDNGATFSPSDWVSGPTDSVASSIGSNPNTSSTTGVFMNNSEWVDRWSMQDQRISWLLGDYPSGMVPGWHATRRYVELISAEPTSDVMAAQLVTRAAGFSGIPISTVRSAGKLKPRLADADGNTKDMGDLTLTNADVVRYSYILPTAPNLAEWNAEVLAELKLRFGFNLGGQNGYHSTGSDFTNGSVLKAASWDVLSRTFPGPPPMCGNPIHLSRVRYRAFQQGNV